MIRCPCCGDWFTDGRCGGCGAVDGGSFVVCVPIVARTPRHNRVVPECCSLTVAERATAIRLLQLALTEE